MEITFLNIEYIWLLLSIPFLIILHLYSLKYVHNRAIKFANFEALERVTGGIVLSKNIFLLTLRLLALLFLTLSLAGTTMWYQGKTNVADYVLAIDSSGSMLADDFDPNRLEAGKEAALVFIDNLEPETMVGVVSFSGSGLVESTLTRDKRKIEQVIKEIEVSSLHGTALGDAIKTSSNMLLDSENPRVIILLTDGQENVASEEELEKIIEFVNSKQIVVNTIGVATEEGGTIPGLSSLSTLDEKTLYSIANSTGGYYIPSKNKQDLLSAYQSFDYESSIKKIPVFLRLPFILFTFLILFIEWIFVNTKYRTIP